MVIIVAQAAAALSYRARARTGIYPREYVQGPIMRARGPVDNVITRAWANETRALKTHPVIATDVEILSRPRFPFPPPVKLSLFLTVDLCRALYYASSLLVR